MTWLKDFRKSMNSMMDSIESLVKDGEKMLEEATARAERMADAPGAPSDDDHQSERVVEEVEHKPDGTRIERKTTIRRSFSKRPHSDS